MNKQRLSMLVFIILAAVAAEIIDDNRWCVLFLLS